MQFIYLAVAAGAVIYIITSKQKLSFLSIYILSCLIYHAPALYNTVYYIGLGRTFHPTAITTETYAVLIINLLAAMGWMILLDMRRDKPAIKIERKTERDNFVMLAISILVLVILGIESYRFMPNVLGGTYNKALFLPSMSTLQQFLLLFVVFITAYAFLHKGRFMIPMRLIVVVLNVIPVYVFAQRSYLVFCMLIIAYIWINRSMERNLWDYIRNHKLMVLGAVLAVIAVFVIKQLIPAIVTMNTGEILRRLQSNFLEETFLYAEPNSITLNLNEIVKQRFYVGGLTYRFTLEGIIPLSETLSGGFIKSVDFNSLFQHEIIPYARGYGMASTFLGEAWSNGGLMLTFLSVNFSCFLMYVTETAFMASRNAYFRTFLLCAMPSLAFYTYRNSLSYTLSSIRDMAYIACFIVLFSLLVYFYCQLRSRTKPLNTGQDARVLYFSKVVTLMQKATRILRNHWKMVLAVFVLVSLAAVPLGFVTYAYEKSAYERDEKAYENGAKLLPIYARNDIFLVSYPHIDQEGENTTRKEYTDLLFSHVSSSSFPQELYNDLIKDASIAEGTITRDDFVKLWSAVRLGDNSIQITFICGDDKLTDTVMESAGGKLAAFVNAIDDGNLSVRRLSSATTVDEKEKDVIERLKPKLPSTTYHIKMTAVSSLLLGVLLSAIIPLLWSLLRKEMIVKEDFKPLTDAPCFDFIRRLEAVDQYALCAMLEAQEDQVLFVGEFTNQNRDTFKKKINGILAEMEKTELADRLCFIDSRKINAQDAKALSDASSIALVAGCARTTFPSMEHLALLFENDKHILCACIL